MRWPEANLRGGQGYGGWIGGRPREGQSETVLRRGPACGCFPAWRYGGRGAGLEGEAIAEIMGPAGPVVLDLGVRWGCYRSFYDVILGERT